MCRPHICLRLQSNTGFFGTMISVSRGKLRHHLLFVFLFHLHLHYPMLLNASFISVPVLEVNGLVSLSRALGLAVLKEVPTFQHLMRNTIPSLETVAMS